MDENNYGRRNRLDFAQLLFAQINRINESFSEVKVLTQSGFVNIGNVNCYSSVKALESMLIPRLSEDAFTEYKKDKKELGLSKLVTGENYPISVSHDLYGLIMRYLVKTGMLPAKAKVFKSLKTEEE